MIISASRRTDVPTFFSEWLENRVREGFLCVRNPMNARQVSRISLDPGVVTRAAAAYDPASPILCGQIGPGDVVTDRKVKSLARRQLSLGI